MDWVSREPDFWKSFDDDFEEKELLCEIYIFFDLRYGDVAFISIMSIIILKILIFQETSLSRISLILSIREVQWKRSFYFLNILFAPSG